MIMLPYVITLIVVCEEDKLWSVQGGSAAHPASYSMGTWGFFSVGEAAGAQSLPLTPI